MGFSTEHAHQFSCSVISHFVLYSVVFKSEYYKFDYQRQHILATRRWNLDAEIFGKVDSYDRELEEWSQYVERLGHFFAAIAIDTEDRKRSIFLSAIGLTPYKLL